MKPRRICTIVFILGFLAAVPLGAQGPDTLWTRTFGGEHDDCCLSVIESSGGEYILAGWTRSFGAGQKDVYLLKVDTNGDTVWTKTYGGAGDDEGCDVRETYDGGYIIAGWTESFGAGGSDVYLIKADSNGNVIWSTDYGLIYNEYSYCVEQTPDSGYIVAGRLNSFSVGGYDVFIVMFDKDGTPILAKFLGSTAWDEGRSLCKTPDGGYIIGGSTMRGLQSLNALLLKIDSNGDTLWSNSYGTSSCETGEDAQMTLDGGFILIGSVLTAAKSCELHLVKTDSLGSEEWSLNHGSTGWDEGHSVRPLSDGGYIVTGQRESETGDGFDMYFSRTYPNGGPLWAETYGGDDHDIGYCGVETSDAGYLIVGKTRSFGAGLYDVYIIKTEPDLGIQEYVHHDPFLRKLEVSPNPFMTSTTIRLSGLGHPDGIVDAFHGTSRAECIELEIFDVTGRRVRDFILYPSSFILDVTWDGRDNNGDLLPSGMYYLKLKTGDYSLTKKIMKIR